MIQALWETLHGGKVTSAENRKVPTKCPAREPRQGQFKTSLISLGKVARPKRFELLAF
jgi:hypothetical protein